MPSIFRARRGWGGRPPTLSVETIYTVRARHTSPSKVGVGEHAHELLQILPGTSACGARLATSFATLYGCAGTSSHPINSGVRTERTKTARHGEHEVGRDHVDRDVGPLLWRRPRASEECCVLARALPSTSRICDSFTAAMTERGACYPPRTSVGTSADCATPRSESCGTGTAVRRNRTRAMNTTLSVVIVEPSMHCARCLSRARDSAQVKRRVRGGYAGSVGHGARAPSQHLGHAERNADRHACRYTGSAAIAFS